MSVCLTFLLCLLIAKFLVEAYRTGQGWHMHTIGIGSLRTTQAGTKGRSKCERERAYRDLQQRSGDEFEKIEGLKPGLRGSSVGI